MRWVHDVSTDPADPPQFVALLDARRHCKNGADYSGLDADAHRKRYPDIATFVCRVSADKVFDAAHAFAETLGWKIAHADKSAGIIEATATTPLLRFKDDIVIRVRALSSGTRLDVRSASRVGESDLGANARRIGTYIDLLNSVLKTNS